MSTTSGPTARSSQNPAPVLRNRELFIKDPMLSALANNGVSEVADVRTEGQLTTLRTEIECFVCEGEYARGLERILNSYVANLDKAEQPAFWVSGFFGSGKSHLVKMLRHLWVDTTLPGGTTARGLAKLPPDIKAALKELSTAGTRLGGLHAAAGTLGSGAGNSVRLALLGIVFRSADLPESYPLARFVLWLKGEEKLDSVRQHLESAGRSFDKELRNLYVSDSMAAALLHAFPDFAPSVAAAKVLLKEQYPIVQDVSVEEMVEAIHDALSVNGRFPCTVIILDEVQQWVGEQSQRTFAVQEVTEACSKRFEGRLLFVATGQTALTGTPYLQKLKDRFRLPIELSDVDVETVIRKIVLAKRADRVPQIGEACDLAIGEISRHLRETKLAARDDDRPSLVPDYPLLPTRRRFWEHTLRAVDRAGTAGQLRTQLRIVHEAVRLTAEEPLGTVVPADFLHDQIASELLSAGVLLREMHETIQRLRTEGPEGIFKARLCALIYMIGKLPRDPGIDTGLRASPEVLSDLLIEDLRSSSADLRKRVEDALRALVDAGVLMQVDSEVRLQTRESSQWENEYRAHEAKLLSDESRIARERTLRLQQRCQEMLREVRIAHGRSKVARRLIPYFGSEMPRPEEGAIPVWIRDGWTDNEKTVQADIRSLGGDSPLIVVHLPRLSAEDIKKALVTSLAAEETLNLRGPQTSNEGIEARNAMETRKQAAEGRLARALSEVMLEARVYLAGGMEKAGGTLAEKVRLAAQDSLDRTFPQYDQGDDPRWSTVVQRVRKGDAGGALSAVDHTGDPEKQPVCARILAEIGPGKLGKEVRKAFGAPRYGWPQETIDGALLVLTACEALRASVSGKPIAARDLDQQKLGVAEFRCETTTISTQTRIDLRRLFQDAGVAYKPNEESDAASRLLAELDRLGNAAGGDPPLPARPSREHLRDLGARTGNDQLQAIHDARERLAGEFRAWSDAADAIAKAAPRWSVLEALLSKAPESPQVEDIRLQVEAIRDRRALLEQPDPVAPLCGQLAAALRESLVREFDAYRRDLGACLLQIAEDPVCAKLDDAQRRRILEGHGLTEPSPLDVATEDSLLDALGRADAATWQTRRDALPQRVAEARLVMARATEPKATRVQLPSATLRSEQELEAWVSDVRTRVVEELKRGPVII